MIQVYKIGKEYYTGTDKNSGLFEYNMIATELSILETYKKVIVIINGKIYDNEDNIINMLKDFDIKIFVMTDEIAIKENLRILNECDYVFHQAYCYNFFEIIKPLQIYGYVPELFYKYVKIFNLNNKKNDKVFFGGNDTGREHKFENYNLYNDNEIIEKRIKTKEKDDRINYIEYLNELSKNKYSLIICRDLYTSINWITSRYFEALALNVIPILDIDYDVLNFLNYDSLKSKNYIDLQYMIENKIYSDIEKLKENAKNNENKFIEIVRRIINEK